MEWHMLPKRTLSNTSGSTLAISLSSTRKGTHSLPRSRSPTVTFRIVESSGFRSVQNPSSCAIRAIRGAIDKDLEPASVTFVREGGCDAVLPQTTGGEGQQTITPLPACVFRMWETGLRGG